MYELRRLDTDAWIMRGTLALCVRAAQLLMDCDRSIPLRIALRGEYETR